MTRIAVEIPVRVPLARLRAFIRESAEEASLAQAYLKLRGKPSPSRVVESTERRLVLFEPAFDPASKGHGLFNTGWTITYGLDPFGAGETAVEIEVTYDWKTALMGAGLIKPQAENEIIHRISTLLAFERGLHAGSAVPAALPAPEPPPVQPAAAPAREPMPRR